MKGKEPIKIFIEIFIVTVMIFMVCYVGLIVYETLSIIGLILYGVIFAFTIIKNLHE